MYLFIYWLSLFFFIYNVINYLTMRNIKDGNRYVRPKGLAIDNGGISPWELKKK